MMRGPSSVAWSQVGTPGPEPAPQIHPTGGGQPSLTSPAAWEMTKYAEAAYWGPNGSVPWGKAGMVITCLGTGLGWLFATLAVAGYTGLVRKADDL